MAEILVGLQGENRLSPSVVQVELLVTCRDLNHVSAWEPDQPITSRDSTLPIQCLFRTCGASDRYTR